MLQKTIQRVDQFIQNKEAEGRKNMQALRPFRAALFGALVTGLLAQGMGLFNKYSWHDDIFSLFMTGTSIQLGRWMLHVLAELEKWFFGNGHFSLPLVNGATALLCIGLSAGLIAVHFRIRSRALCALLGAVMAAFPAVTSLFGFMYTIHYYMAALLMLTAGCLLICDEKSWLRKVLGVLLSGCAIGVYQAFIPILLMLILLDAIRMISQREEKSSFYLQGIALRLLCIAGVMGVYYAGNQFFLQMTHLRLDDYLGINEMGGATLGQYLAGAGRAYREFFFPSHFVLWDMYPQAVFNLYRLMLVLDAVLGAGMIIRLWKKNPVRALLLGAALALVPLGCNFIFVMTEEVHSLMVYGQVMQMVLLICLTEWTGTSAPSCRRLLSGGTALLLALCGTMYIRYDNQCYMKTAFQQQEAIAWNTTLVTRIESAEGFRDDMKIAFLNRKNMKDQNLYNLDELDFLSLGTYDADLQTYLNDWAWEEFLERWCGFEPEMMDPALVEDWEEVKNMPAYPDDGSIRVIRDIVVVNF